MCIDLMNVTVVLKITVHDPVNTYLYTEPDHQLWTNIPSDPASYKLNIAARKL